eukprot:scpid99820/ scgid7632/ 
MRYTPLNILQGHTCSHALDKLRLPSTIAEKHTTAAQSFFGLQLSRYNMLYYKQRLEVVAVPIIYGYVPSYCPSSSLPPYYSRETHHGGPIFLRSPVVTLQHAVLQTTSGSCSSSYHLWLCTFLLSK